jgi:hypothetical protein
MSQLSEEILDVTRTREVAGVFHSRKALDAAVEDLFLAGVDRSDIDVSASPDELQRRVNYSSLSPPDLADMPTAARRPFFGLDDLLGMEAVVASLIGCASALATSFYLVVKDVTPFFVALWSILIGVMAGGIAIVPVYRLLRRDRARGLEGFAEWDGILIWVRVHSPEMEVQAQEILVRHGGQAVHVHEIELAKRPEDLPFHSLRPDPWLGDERLGRP